jgi:DNA helicase-2/ATP-dependent DNA helicase PcrA
MEGFESLTAFLEHVSLVMEIAQDESGDRINLMTLHAAKGLEFNTVFLPGWEEGLFPSQRTMDENGLAGLEEERRLAYVGLTRARQRIRISFAANRRVHGSWQSALPSRFIKEIPESHVDVAVDDGFYGGYAGFRDNDNAASFGSTYARGDRVFHQKFGYGRVSHDEGNKLTVDFDKAGEKRVIDQFVSRA